MVFEKVTPPKSHESCPIRAAATTERLLSTSFVKDILVDAGEIMGEKY